MNGPNVFLIIPLIILILAAVLKLKKAKKREHEVLIKESCSQADSRRLKEKIQAIEKIKSHSLSQVSYEMLIPLTSTLGYSELLLKPQLMPEKYKQFAKGIQVHGKILTAQFNRWIALFQDENIEINLAECSIQALLKRVEDTLSPLFKEKNIFLKIELVGEMPGGLMTDGKKLRKVLENLAAYLLRMSQPSGVRLQVAYQNDCSLKFQFRYWSKDIEENEIKNLDPFVSRIDSELILVQPLLKSIGGKITYQKEVSGQKVICIDLMTKQPKTPSSLHHIKILCAEDNEDIQEILKVFLEGTGALIEVVDNGYSAYQKAMEAFNQDAAYDIILLDIAMPKMAGIEVAEHLRKQGYKGPILALTAYSAIEEADKCKQAGFNEVIAKPFNQEELVKIISRFL